jgi:hypothetical protein
MSETHAEVPLNQADDETKRIEFEVVRPPYRPHKNPRGQARRLTLRVFIRICHLVEQGWAITKACESESITYSLFRLRCTENQQLEQRIKKAIATRFERRHEEALAIVMRAGERDWTACAWWLERNLPALYSLKTVDRSEAVKDLKPEFSKIRVITIPDDEFEKILGNSNYTLLADGTAERIEGSLRLVIVRQSRGRTLLPE